MSYETALKIVDVIQDIHKGKYRLPAIQREFVWNPSQIEKLFDSLMRDYPINSFLFWKVEKEKVNDYEFYEFLRNYHERYSVHNPKADVTGEDEITAVLDGQQRLTSLYIAFKGSYSYRLPRKRWDNDMAYPKRYLYLNLVKGAEEQELEFDFKFLTKDEIKRDNKNFWFLVAKILTITEPGEVNSYLIENKIFQDYTQEQADFANKTLFKLFLDNPTQTLPLIPTKGCQ